MAGVIRDAQPTSVYEHDRETTAFFAGTIKEQSVDGVVRTRTDEHSRVAAITLMVRPWAALKAGIADITLWVRARNRSATSRT